MAKRARGSTTRPGQRARLAADGRAEAGRIDRAAAPEPTGLTAEEEARAAALEAQIVAEERAAETQAEADRDRAKREPPSRSRAGRSPCVPRRSTPTSSATSGGS